MALGFMADDKRFLRGNRRVSGSSQGGFCWVTRWLCKGGMECPGKYPRVLERLLGGLVVHNKRALGS